MPKQNIEKQIESFSKMVEEREVRRIYININYFGHSKRRHPSLSSTDKFFENQKDKLNDNIAWLKYNYNNLLRKIEHFENQRERERERERERVMISK